MVKLKTRKLTVKKSKSSKKVKGLIVFLGLFLLLIAMLLNIYNFSESSELAEDEEQIEEFFESDIQADDDNNDSDVSQESCIAVLEIPAIDLKTCLVDPASDENDVDKHVQIIDGSQFPSIENGNFILAAHSGTSSISYFKNLYKLELGDNIYVYYDDVEYEYVLANFYDVEKNGEVEIRRNSNKNTLTLITCTKDSDTLQTIYVAYLKEQY